MRSIGSRVPLWAGMLSVLSLVAVAAASSLAFEGTGTIISDPSSGGGGLVFYWDGGVVYWVDRVDSFAAGDRVTIQGELAGYSLAVASISSAGPFEECGRLEAEEFCPAIFYCGRYHRSYILSSLGGFQVGDSVRAVLRLRVNTPDSYCMVWPWWNVASMTLCDSATTVSRVTWGRIRGMYR